MAQTVLVIEDEPNIVEVVRGYLERDGFVVEAAGDGPTGLRRALELQPVLVVLDLMLPGLDGIEVCRQLRRMSDVPVLMLTAKVETDKLLGLEAGADDYLTKPFSPRELVARVHAILRRAASAAPAGQGRVLRHRGLVIDLDRHTVLRDGVPIELTALEFAILAALFERPGRVWTRDALVERCWGLEFKGDDRVVPVHIASLRRKLGDDPLDPTLIETVRGIGYRAKV
jgi:two-component system response regulator ResD